MSVVVISSLVVGSSGLYGLNKFYNYLFNNSNDPVQMEKLSDNVCQNLEKKLENSLVFDSLDSEYKFCTSCKKNKSREDFSNRQFKSNNRARCKICIENS